MFEAIRKLFGHEDDIVGEITGVQKSLCTDAKEYLEKHIEKPKPTPKPKPEPKPEPAPPKKTNSVPSNPNIKFSLCETSEEDNDEQYSIASDRRFSLRLEDDLFRPKYDLATIQKAIAEGDRKTINSFLRKTFVQEVQDAIREKGLRDSDVYKAAGIDRRLFSKMMSDLRYHPSKDTAFSIALALKLDKEEATELLNRAGYVFSTSTARDVVLEFCFVRGVYDIVDVNIILDKLGFEPLGR